MICDLYYWMEQTKLSAPFQAQDSVSLIHLMSWFVNSGFSIFQISCDKTEPRAYFDASVVRINDYENLDITRVSCWLELFCKFQKISINSFVCSTLVSFFRQYVNLVSFEQSHKFPIVFY